MKRALALVSADPRLAEIEAQANTKLASVNTRRKFAQKQLEDLRREAMAIAEVATEEMTAYFRERGMLPADFDPKRHHFHSENGAVVICDETGPEQGGLGAILSSLFNGPPDR